MKPGSKYEPLYQHLRRSGKDELRLTFAQIEKLMGSELPGSARQSHAFWSNRGSGALQAEAWMKAGYHMTEVDLEEERVTFRKPSKAYRVRHKDGEIVWDGEAVQALRQHMGLNQQGLAEVLGVRQQTVSEWETGAYAPSRAMAKYLALVAERAGFEYGE